MSILRFFFSEETNFICGCITAPLSLYTFGDGDKLITTIVLTAISSCLWPLTLPGMLAFNVAIEQSGSRRH